MVTKDAERIHLMQHHRLKGTQNIPGGILCGHVWNEVRTLMKVIKAYDIHHFVEIGVHEGGLTYLLLRCFPDLHYLGIDNNLNITKEIVRWKVNASPNAELLERDCFEYETVSEVWEWMPKDKPCLLYCDNGNKPKEVRRYYALLRPGDILMVHDYHDGKRIVKDIEHYGYTKDFPMPEVCPEDVAFLYEDCEEIDRVDLSQTRMIGFVRL